MKQAKYEVYYERLKHEHESLFVAFKRIHDAYSSDSTRWSDTFHTEGTKVLDLLRETERRLCAGMMRGGYASYSTKLSEKYWDLVKKDYPLIDQVGVKKRNIAL